MNLLLKLALEKLLRLLVDRVCRDNTTDKKIGYRGMFDDWDIGRILDTIDKVTRILRGLFVEKKPLLGDAPDTQAEQQRALVNLSECLERGDLDGCDKCLDCLCKA